MKRPEQWDKIKELVGAALEKEVSERPAFLDDACAQDQVLRAEVESLVAAYEESDQLPENPWTGQLASAEQVDIIGPYKLLRKLGEGGMGQVWLAEQTAPVKRQVALKLIKWGMFDRSALQRFQSERQSIAIMDHPSIAKVFEAGATPDGQPYFVMEYVPGIPITDWCDQMKLKIPERLELFIKVCDGVQHAHQKAIIHRDLKPANILVIEVDGKPVPRIIDFGLAKGTTPEVLGQAQFTIAGSFLGTPGYMSPEQADANVQDVDTRTDVYSLGAVLYVLLSGSLPFQTEQRRNQPFHEVMRQLREEDPPRPSAKAATQRDSMKNTAQARGIEPQQLVSLLRGDLDWITVKALERDRTRRYATPSELAADIRRYLRHEPVQARPASVSYRLQKYVRRHRIGVAVVSLLVAVLVAFAVVQSVQLRRITRERDRADRIAQFMTGVFKVSDPNEKVGNTVTAREVLNKASKDIDTGLLKDPELQARMMHVMGRAYKNLGLQSQAQSLFERSIKVGSSILGSENPETLSTMNELSWTLFQQGHLSEAERLQRKVLDIQRRVLGPEHLDTLQTMGQLANTLCEEGNCAEAVKLDREVLEKKKRLLGPEASDTLVTMDNLSTELALQGRLEEAEKLEEETLEIYLRVFGRERLGTMSSMINLASIQRDMGRHEDAEKLFRETLDLEGRVLGSDQPETAETKYELACLLTRRGQIDEALSLLRQAVDHGLHSRVDLKIENEPYFNSLHGDPRFTALVAHAKKRAAAQDAN